MVALSLGWSCAWGSLGTRSTRQVGGPTAAWLRGVRWEISTFEPYVDVWRCLCEGPALGRKNERSITNSSNNREVADTFNRRRIDTS
mmetsp:Transcript_23681/g.76051  ORF Transcript_23681/g.76051 Transcript_23681/m.76051 type:complete len:87 (+) Transcript_23681:518-778(+)